MLGAAANAGHCMIGFNLLAAFRKENEFIDTAVHLVNDGQQFDSGETCRLAIIESALRHPVGRDRRGSGNVTRPYVFSQGQCDQFPDLGVVPSAHWRDSRSFSSCAL